MNALVNWDVTRHRRLRRLGRSRERLIVSYRMQKVGLAKTGIAVDEERIVGLGGLFSDTKCCGMSEAI